MIEKIPVLNRDQADKMDYVGKTLLMIIDKLNEIVDYINDQEKKNGQ